MYAIDDHDQVSKYRRKKIPSTELYRANPVSYSVGTGAALPEVKRSGHEANHSPKSITEVKKEWRCTSTPPIAFMVCTRTTLSVPLLPW
jgi:hypothetical protein